MFQAVEDASAGKIQAELQDYIGRYDAIYMLSGEGNWNHALLERLAGHPSSKKYLALLAGGGEGAWAGCAVDHVVISQAEYDGIKRLYHMYEFSDRFRILDDDSAQYGTLRNYVVAGLMTEAEMAEAFLWMRE